MIAKFYTLTKRDNSTLQPTGDGTQKTIELKFPSGVLNPVMTTADSSVLGYNYVHIPTYNRYYFIRDWDFIDGLWHIHLFEDCLASWKSSIGSASLYVLRSSSSHDGYIRDAVYPAKDKYTLQRVNITRPWDVYGGYYIIGVVSPSNNASAVGGSTTYYQITKNGMNQLIHDLLNTIGTELANATDPNEFLSESITMLSKTLSNPLQWIKSCIWLPFKPSTGTPENIWLGLWDTGIQGAPVLQHVSTKSTAISVSLPNHPQIARGSWLNTPPYRRMVLNAGPFGTIELPADMLQGVTSISGDLYMDAITGDATLHLHGGDYEINYHAGIGVDVGLAQIYTSAHDFINAATKTVGGTVGIAENAVKMKASAVVNSVGAVANGIVDMAEAGQGTPSSTGQDGSFGALYESWSLITAFMEIADEDISRLGRPLCQVKQISNLSGFIQCAEGDIPAAATMTELQTIKSYLEGGFYYE